LHVEDGLVLIYSFSMTLLFSFDESFCQLTRLYIAGMRIAMLYRTCEDKRRRSELIPRLSASAYAFGSQSSNTIRKGMALS
jgi:hypothetical protein